MTGGTVHVTTDGLFWSHGDIVETRIAERNYRAYYLAVDKTLVVLADDGSKQEYLVERFNVDPGALRLIPPTISAGGGGAAFSGSISVGHGAGGGGGGGA